MLRQQVSRPAWRPLIGGGERLQLDGVATGGRVGGGLCGEGGQVDREVVVVEDPRRGLRRRGDGGGAGRLLDHGLLAVVGAVVLDAQEEDPGVAGVDLVADNSFVIRDEDLQSCRP